MQNGHDYYFCDQSLPDIPELRNMLATLWYDRTDAEWFLGVDADMAFYPELILDMLKFGKPLMGCFYPKRTLPISFVGKPLPGEQRREGGFLEVEAVGGGVLMFNRECIKMLLDSGQAVSDTALSHHVSRDHLASWGVNRIIRAFDKIKTDRGEISEDYSFCRRYRNAGGEVWACTAHSITHVGPYGYTARYQEGA